MSRRTNHLKIPSHHRFSTHLERVWVEPEVLSVAAANVEQYGAGRQLAHKPLHPRPRLVASAAEVVGDLLVHLMQPKGRECNCQKKKT